MPDEERFELAALSGSDLDEWFEARDSQLGPASDLALPSLVREGLRLHSESERLKMLNEAFAENAWSDSEFHFYRIMVFWRTTRWILMQKQLVQHGQRLEEALEQSPRLFSMRNSRYVRPLHGYETIRKLMQVPLPVHPRHCENDEDRKQLQALHLLVAMALELPKGSEKLPSFGQLGLRYMDSTVNTFGNLFPSEMELINFERDLIIKTADVMAKKTRGGAERWLRSRYALKNDWGKDVLSMAADVIVMRSSYTHDQKKAMMAWRLETIIDKAQKALDIHTELRALKMLAAIEGLNSTAESDQRRSFIQLLQNDDDGGVQRHIPAGEE